MAEGEKKEVESSPEKNWNEYYNNRRDYLQKLIGKFELAGKRGECVHSSDGALAFGWIRRLLSNT